MPSMEEYLTSLRDDARWDMQDPTPRDLSTVAEPRASRGRMWAIGIATGVTVMAAVAAIIIAVSLRPVGDSEPIAPIPTPTGASTSTPAPTPTAPTAPATPAPGADGSRPPQVFGGDCSAMLTTKQLEQASGHALADVYDYPYTDNIGWQPLYAAVEHGGITCRWTSDAQDSLPFIHVVALPAQAVSTTADAVCAMRNGYCYFDRTVDGIRFSGMVKSTDNAATRSLATKIDAMLVVAAPGNSVQAPVAPAGAWSPQDCEAVVADLQTALPSLTYTSSTSAGGDPTAETDLLAATFGTDEGCGGNSQDDAMPFVTVTLFGGGAWQRDLIESTTGSVQSVTVPGFDHADVYGSPGGEGIKTLWLFRGVNAMQVTWPVAPEKAMYTALSTIADHADAEAPTADSTGSTLEDTATIVVSSEGLELRDAAGATIGTYSYFNDDDLTMVKALRTAFGSSPTHEQNRDTGGVDYSWPGLTLGVVKSYSLPSGGTQDPLTSVVVKAADVEGVHVVLTGGVSVGDPLTKVAALAHSREDAYTPESYDVDITAVKPEDRPHVSGDQGDKWMLVEGANGEVWQIITPAGDTFH